MSHLSNVFISDLHLSAEAPEITRRFVDFMREHASKSDQCYILGDLFEGWLGDDAIFPQHDVILESLNTYTQNGGRLFLMHGNRDFLLGEEFCRRCGAELLPDPVMMELAGHRVLLMHGDSLCIDDVDYQKIRRQVRTQEWKNGALALSVEQRLQLAQQYRLQSTLDKQAKDEDIMDANQTEIERIMSVYEVRFLIHGHTHRPAIHRFHINGTPAVRIVLGDWFEQTSFLYQNNTSLELRDPRIETAAVNMDSI